MKIKLHQRFLLIGLGFILSLVAATAQAAMPNQPIINEMSTVKSTQQLIGTWELISYETRNLQGDLVTASPWHYDRGLLIYDETGRVAVQLVNDARPAFSQGDFTEVASKATPGELKDNILGYLAYFGTFTIDEQKQTVTHHIEASTNNYAGTAQLRNFEIKGNQLTLFKKANLAQGAKQNQLSSRIIWERIK